MQNPSFLITNKILNAISKIEAAEEVIKHAPLLPLWEKQFKEDAVVRAVYHGTHLEGNRLQKDEAKDVLLGKDVAARPRDIQEVINYRKVIELIDEEVKRKIENITEPFIKKSTSNNCDKVLEDDMAGEYRKTGCWLKILKQVKLHSTPPSAIDVPFLMRSLCTG